MVERIQTANFTVDMASRSVEAHSVLSEHPEYWQELHLRITDALRAVEEDFTQLLKETKRSGTVPIRQAPTGVFTPPVVTERFVPR